MAPSTDDELKLDDLARRAGVSARTVRYYVQRGLLPAPAFRGRDTAYGRAHLVRLRAIRRLQECFLPLDQIQIELARRSESELEALADGRAPVPAVATVSVTPIPEPADPRDSAAWRRFVLAPGLELHLSDDAPSDVRALASHLRELATRGGRK